MCRCLMDSKPRKMTVEDYRVLNSCGRDGALCMIATVSSSLLL